MRVLILLSILGTIVGCAAGGQGATKEVAEDILIIQMHSPGYKRLAYILEFHGPEVRACVHDRGYPDFIYEFKDGGRKSVNFYYVNQNAVAIFGELSGRTDSFALVQTREMNDFEKGKLEGKAPTRGLSRPPYPPESRALREQGIVELMLWVRADGTVGEATVAQSSGYPRLDQAAATHALKWRFIPGTDDGKAIAMHYPMKVKFSLDD